MDTRGGTDFRQQETELPGTNHAVVVDQHIEEMIAPRRWCAQDSLPRLRNGIATAGVNDAAQLGLATGALKPP